MKRKSPAELDRDIAESLSGKAKYLGQCDRVRMASASNEQKWHAIMAGAKKLSAAAFLKRVDFSPLLDDGDTPQRYIADATRTDSSTATYRSMWGDKPCWFLQTAGFEFIFVE